MPPGGKEVHTVRLDCNSQEYREVSDHFYATAQNVSITSIERIQNPLLYRTYVLKKENMDKVNGGNTERRLFHGTSSESITPINKQGFNRSLCGKNGEYNFTGFWIGGGLLYMFQTSPRFGWRFNHERSCTEYLPPQTFLSLSTN